MGQKYGNSLYVSSIQGDTTQIVKSNIFIMDIFFRIFGILCTLSHRTVMILTKKSDIFHFEFPPEELQ